MTSIRSVMIEVDGHYIAKMALHRKLIRGTNVQRLSFQKCIFVRISWLWSTKKKKKGVIKRRDIDFSLRANYISYYCTA